MRAVEVAATHKMTPKHHLSRVNSKHKSLYIGRRVYLCFLS